MNEYQVTCINKPYRMSPHEHITHIGNVTNVPTNRWRMTREEAIRRSMQKKQLSTLSTAPPGGKCISVLCANHTKIRSYGPMQTASGMTTC